MDYLLHRLGWSWQVPTRRAAASKIVVYEIRPLCDLNPI
ncbi:winged helix-turn-helix domain-containing protein [Nonomuraea sp. NPDC003707]